MKTYFIYTDFQQETLFCVDNTRFTPLELVSSIKDYLEEALDKKVDTFCMVGKKEADDLIQRKVHNNPNYRCSELKMKWVLENSWSKLV